MPFGAIPVIGAGAGAGAATADIQAKQQQERDLMAQLLMHAQNLQAQREATAAYRGVSAQAAAENAVTRKSNLNRQVIGSIASGNEVPPDLAQSPEAAGQVQAQQSLPSVQFSGFSQIPSGGTDMPTSAQTGAATSGEMQAQQAPSAPTGRFTKLQSAGEQDKSQRDQEMLDFRRMVESRLASGQSFNQDFKNRSLDQQRQLAEARLRQMQAGGGGKNLELKTAKDADGNDTWVIVDKGTRTVNPVDTSGGYKPPANATTENRLTSAKAVNQTGMDIINAVKANSAELGPLMSRYNNVLDFIGNPPPQFAKLAGQIESFSLANMGVHGMRSASGAEAIKQTIGLGRHTPESLIATIEGLQGFAQHFMENEGRATDKQSGGVPEVGGTFQGGKVLKVEKVK